MTAAVCDCVWTPLLYSAYVMVSVRGSVRAVGAVNVCATGLREDFGVSGMYVVVHGHRAVAAGRVQTSTCRVRASQQEWKVT